MVNSKGVISEIDRLKILTEDGVEKNQMNEYNKDVVSVSQIISSNPTDTSWSYTIVNSPSNCATLIAQMPGEGNRTHYHPDWDEWWFILQGEWVWLVDGEKKEVKTGDVVFIKRGRVHKITASGVGQSIRLAVSRADVAHVYEENDY